MVVITLYSLFVSLKNTVHFTKDPDGNGENDTYGMNAYGGWKDTNIAIYGAFNGIPDQNYLSEDGYIYSCNTSDDFRAALTYLNELWTADAIDPEFFVASSDQALRKHSAHPRPARILSFILSRRAFEPIQAISERFEHAFGNEEFYAKREVQGIIGRVDSVIARNKQLESQWRHSVRKNCELCF